MMHNSPYSLDKTIVKERKFADILKETYTRLDGLETRVREHIAEAIDRFTQDPAEGIQWRAESAVANQTQLSVLTEIKFLINNSETIEDVRSNFTTFATRYRTQIIGWASYGESSTSAFSNITSRVNLAATAEMFGTWGLANEIERAIETDIQETHKRVVVMEFVDLKVDETFRLSPDTSTTLFRKLSPRKAIECTYPSNQATKHTVETRAKVYLFRVPMESDVIYANNGAVAA